MDKEKFIGGVLIALLVWGAISVGPERGGNWGSDQVAATESADIAASGACAGVHVVAAGETLLGIAQQYGYSVAALAQASGIANPNLVWKGKLICLPKSPSGQAAASSCSQQHTVAPGETLGHIASRYGTTVEALAASNGIPNPNRVNAGRELCVSP